MNMFNNKNLYPTPDWLINKMLEKINLRSYRNILEPSAGFGSIIERIQTRMSSRDLEYCNIDAIEIDKVNLVPILKEKGIKVVHDDFLTFSSLKSYGLIIANPPFSQDCKHLLKMIELQERSGGDIVCLVNAETIKNPFSNDRKHLLNKLDKYNADIEFIEDAFADKESMRKTGVEVALIYMRIDKEYKNSVIIDHLKQEEEYKRKQSDNTKNSVVANEFMEQIIAKYNFEVNAGVKLIDEYEQLLPMMSRDFDTESPILELSVFDEQYSRENDSLVNKFIKKVRYKYWQTLFRSKEFSSLLTNDLRIQYSDKMEELQDYDFSEYNINQIKLDIKLMLGDSLEQTIFKLFDDLISHAHWHGYEGNIHYYNGWRTNSASMVNDKRNILPWNAYGSWKDNFSPSYYTFLDKIRDIHKVFTYLDNGKTMLDDDIFEILRQAEDDEQTKDIDLGYFTITCFKKGTTHFKWKRQDLIKKLNILGAQNRNWLPPSYGNPYDTMTKEEQTVIDSFQGKDDYEKTMQDKNFYLGGVGSDLLMLGN